MNLLEVKNISKSFDDLQVLKDISLSVNEKEVVSILGPSGSGKSTFLQRESTSSKAFSKILRPREISQKRK